MTRTVVQRLQMVSSVMVWMSFSVSVVEPGQDQFRLQLNGAMNLNGPNRGFRCVTLPVVGWRN